MPRSAARRWNGLCPARRHGLDFEGQTCDLCSSHAPAAQPPRERGETVVQTPASVEEARQLYDAARVQAEGIEAQLGDESRRERLGADYDGWRGRAKGALTHQRRRQTHYRRWLEGQGAWKPRSLSEDGYALLKSCLAFMDATDDRDLTDEDSVLMERVRRYLQVGDGA